MKRTVVSFLVFCLSYFGTCAQSIENDTLSASVFSVVQQYKSARNENLLLYNGIEYARSYLHTTGHPFLFSDTFRTGSLVYDNVLYQNVALNYNTESNRVVIKNKDNFLIELISEKINSFMLDNRLFVSLSKADIPKGDMQPSIYEWHPYSPASVFIRHQKVVQRASNAADPDYFKEYTDIFIKQGDKIVHVKSSRDLLNAFAEQQGAINSYLRQNHLTFKRNPEEAAIQAAAYYAQLKTK